MEDSNLPPAGQDPQDVESGAQTSGLAGLIDHLAAERPQAECSYFDYLNSERDAYYGYTIKKSYQIINESSCKAAQNNPKEIAKCLHNSMVSINVANVLFSLVGDIYAGVIVGIECDVVLGHAKDEVVHGAVYAHDLGAHADRLVGFFPYLQADGLRGVIVLV